MKHVKNVKNYDVGYIGFTMDDLDGLNVKVTSGPVAAIGMWAYMSVQITGILVVI